MDPGILSTAKAAVEGGQTEAAFAAVRAALAESIWSVALLKTSGDLLAALAARPDLGGVHTERLAVVGGCTTGILLPALRCALAEEGRLALIYEGPFGAFRQEILDPSSGLHRCAPETVLIVRSWRELRDVFPRPGDSADHVEAAIEAEVASLEELWSVLERRHRCRILQHELELPDTTFIGPAETTHPASHAGFVTRLNARLRQAAAGRVAWVEVEGTARRVGAERWSPADLYHLAKLPLNVSQLHAYARLVQGAWRIAANRVKKVLVTDLDNTLWGGVIGDDGTEGIVLGPGTAAGEAYQDFCRFLSSLQQRGVVLAVCSKNDREIALRPFVEHPHMPLREEDFSAIHCSWGDKAAGLREIARALNLSADSMVYVDDNPAECALVRREIPEITTVHLAGDPSLFPALIESRHLFDRNALTKEDVERGRTYRLRDQAEQLRSSATDLDSFLVDLRMEGVLDFAAPADMDRLAQLEEKTNQFNLTTARFSRSSLDGFVAASDHDVLAFRLRDRFVDHGLVSSLVLRVAGDRLHILNWTLSCRVFARGAEDFIRNRLLELCRARGLRGITGWFRPTAKNGVIAELLPRLGFVPGDDEGWFLAADTPALPCHIHDLGSLRER